MTVLVRGTGDIASAVAHCLFQAGYGVVMHDVSQPSTARRGMAFTDAVFDRRAMLAGVEGIRLDDIADTKDALAVHAAIPIVVGDLAALLNTLTPDVLVDARMRKRAEPEVQRGLATFTIGLGPNFIAGQTTDVVIETGWGEDLGRVVKSGSSRPLAGEPRSLGGHARDRYVYAPSDGIFRTTCHIGDAVRHGDLVAELGWTPLSAPLDGVLRGLTRDSVPVSQGTKVIEIDPRGSAAEVRGIGERPRRIAAGVREAIREWLKERQP